jgi:hypothetical protein
MVAARIFVPAAALVAATLQGQQVSTVAVGEPTVSGKVRDVTGTPVSEVEVGVIRGERLQQFVITSADGKFLISGLARGIVPLRIRRLGYAMQFLDVDTRAPVATALDIVLTAVPNELEEVTIEADDRRLREFYQRREQRGSFARFLDQNEIRRMGATNSSDLFRTMPGISIGAGTGGGKTIRIRGCQPMVRLDGQRVPGAELDDLIKPSEIAAIEFYPSNAGVPAQYLERSNRLCGLVIVWTRAQ